MALECAFVLAVVLAFRVPLRMPLCWPLCWPLSVPLCFPLCLPLCLPLSLPNCVFLYVFLFVYLCCLPLPKKTCPVVARARAQYRYLLSIVPASKEGWASIYFVCILSVLLLLLQHQPFVLYFLYSGVRARAVGDSVPPVHGRPQL